MLTFGIGTTVDAERATDSFRKACAGNYPAACHNAEEHAEHWLYGTEGVLLERLHAPDPALVLENVPSGWKAVLATSTCFTNEALEPVSVHIVESSGQPSLDAAVLEALHGWRYRVRPEWKLELPVCLPNVFHIRKQ